MSFLTSQPTTVVILGDSTSVGQNGWARLLFSRLAKAWPTAKVVHRVYSFSNDSYDPATTLWDGGGSTITVYNGSVGSTTADYPLANGSRLAWMIPADPDVVILNYGHNHTTESAATFEGKLDTLLAAVQTLYASTPIVISSQNHEKSPATNATSHNTRQAHLSTYASGHSYGYIGAYEAFQAQGTPNNFVQSDGVHPTETGAGDGAHLWADTAASFLLPADDPDYAALTWAQRMAALAPAAWFRLNETSGTTMNDSSGNARHGAFDNSPTLGVTGALGGSGDNDKAATFNDAVSSYGYVTYASWMNPTVFDYTISAWVKSTDTDGVFIGRVGTGAHPYFGRVYSTLGFYAEGYNGSGGGFYAHDGDTAGVRDGNWHFLVATYRDGYLTTFVDGVKVAQNTSGSGPTGQPKALTSPNHLFIGAALGGPFLSGSVDEPALTMQALTPEQIAELYTAGTTPPPAASITGTATPTLPSLTASVAGTVSVPVFTGVVAAALPALSASAAGAFTSVDRTGAVAATLPALTASLAGTHTSNDQVGTVEATLPALTGSAVGAFTAAATTGTVAATLPALTAVVEMGSDRTGVVAGTLPPLSASIVGVFDDGTVVPPIDDEAAPVDDEVDGDVPPLELPPEGFLERPIWRRSVIVPDLSAYPKDPITGQPHVTDAEYDSFEVIREEVGVPHLIFPDNDDPNDVTYYRGAPLQGLRFLRREPFGDADADATIPGITSMDTHPDDVGAPHPFTRARANMEFVLKKSDGSQRRLWSGNVFTRSLGNDGRQPSMQLHALGSLYMADSTRNRPVVSDDPLDYGYLIPRAFNLVISRRYKSIAHIATGILTNERGAWSDSPMGFALDGLAKCWTVGGRQWTIAKVVGSRRQYEMRLKKTAVEWTFTNGARGVYVDLEEDDNGRNVVYGHGVNADGGVWYNTKYPDNGSVTRRPLAADPRTQRYTYDSDGNITGTNPDFDGNVMPREDDVDFGQNSKTIGIRSAQQIVDRESVPSFVGRITVETDPREGWRGDIQAGDKMKLIGYQGRDLILHVSDVDVSLDGSMPVTLTVDERSRDAMTVAQIRERNKEARRDPGLRPGNPNRRSRLEVDQIVPFDSESPAGRIPSFFADGGEWTVISVPFATAGRIAKVHFDTGSPMAAGLFAYRPSVGTLNSLIGNPLTQDDPLKAHMNTLEGTFGLVAFWGQKGQRMGYSPGTEDGGDPFTGDFDEATGFDYVAQANARLYLAVYAAASTTVSGRCYPALVV